MLAQRPHTSLSHQYPLKLHETAPQQAWSPELVRKKAYSEHAWPVSHQRHPDASQVLKSLPVNSIHTAHAEASKPSRGRSLARRSDQDSQSSTSNHLSSLNAADLPPSTKGRRISSQARDRAKTSVLDASELSQKLHRFLLESGPPSPVLEDLATAVRPVTPHTSQAAQELQYDRQSFALSTNRNLPKPYERSGTPFRIHGEPDRDQLVTPVMRNAAQTAADVPLPPSRMTGRAKTPVSFRYHRTMRQMPQRRSWQPPSSKAAVESSNVHQDTHQDAVADTNRFVPDVQHNYALRSPVLLHDSPKQDKGQSQPFQYQVYKHPDYSDQTRGRESLVSIKPTDISLRNELAEKERELAIARSELQRIEAESTHFQARAYAESVDRLVEVERTRHAQEQSRRRAQRESESLKQAYDRITTVYVDKTCKI